MRLLFLTNFYPPHHIGGYEELCAEVGDGLQLRGHTVVVLTSDYRKNREEGDRDNILRVLHPEVSLHPYRGIFDFFVNRTKYQEENINRLKETVDEIKSDAIVVWGMWNLHRQLLALLETKEMPALVYYIADYWPTLPDAYTLYWQEQAKHGFASVPKRVVGKAALATLARETGQPRLNFKNTLCVSQAVIRELVDGGIPVSNARVIYNGIDLDKFGSAAKLHAGRSRSETLEMVYAGRISPEKGIPTALEALSILTLNKLPARLTIIGSGQADYLHHLKHLCNQLGLTNSVKFTGYIPREEIPNALAKYDVLVAPSVWPEPLPRIIQEAMAVGLIVVGTSVGGIPEILEDGVNGLIFAPEDSSQLARCLEKLALDPDLCLQLAQCGQQTVKEKFDVKRMLDEFEQYLESLVNL
jgi:glycosyltransferase involved in cell wall biosynthesis